ncbi:unnamed protein product [Candidatus Paraburkholderia kirkii UZHbot1]|uniref:WGS project CAFE00000000 data, contig bkir_c141 n=1 Tax=Candidatus Paraburkholderia kirkii UZHbot1 TaxID=1055526 RepID=U3UAL4_9BURK|nr:unnamed protein product [Candidatus Paraburkholderia kirkii UZHbot1]
MNPDCQRILAAALPVLLAAACGGNDGGSPSATQMTQQNAASPKAVARISPPGGPFPTTTCFWRGPFDSEFVDTSAGYWTASFTIPAGKRVFLKSQYPYARYMSLVSYSAGASANDHLSDIDIAPDSDGSINQFVPGNMRYQTPRNYTVEVTGGARPSSGALANTLFRAAQMARWRSCCGSTCRTARRARRAPWTCRKSSFRTRT